MFSQINNSHKNEQPKAEDKSVQDEINILNQNKINILNQDEIQPMGNEAANDQFKEYYSKMLREANEDNMLDFSGFEGAEENSIIGKKSSPNNFINNKPNQIEKSLDESDDNIDLNNSMYLNSSHNIVNEEALERLLDNKQKKKSKIGKKEPDQKDIADIKDAFKIAEEIAEEQPQVKDTDTRARPDTYAQDEDMVVHTGKKKKKRDDGGLENPGIVENANDMADEYWKSAARERLQDFSIGNQDDKKKSYCRRRGSC